MPQNSLPAPSLPVQLLSVANELTAAVNSSKTVPHPFPPINKLQSHRYTKSQPINQAALTIRNCSKTTHGFNMRRADDNFRLWW